MKTYKLVFDFHFNVAIRHWNSIDQTLVKSDLMMEFNEIAAHDEFVDSWSDSTKGRCASQYLTILRQTGLLTEKTNQLQSVRPDNDELTYYFRSGEEWFWRLYCFILTRLMTLKQIYYEKNDSRRVV